MIFIKYYRTIQILKNKGSDEIVDEVHGYAMAESLEILKENKKYIMDIDVTYQLYDVEEIYEECSKEEYDEYSDSIITLEDLKNKNIQ